MCPNRPVVWKCSILGEGAHCYRKRPTLVEPTRMDHPWPNIYHRYITWYHMLGLCALSDQCHRDCTLVWKSWLFSCWQYLTQPKLTVVTVLFEHDRGWPSHGTYNERSSQELSTYHSKYIQDVAVKFLMKQLLPERRYATAPLSHLPSPSSGLLVGLPEDFLFNGPFCICTRSS